MKEEYHELIEIFLFSGCFALIPRLESADASFYCLVRKREVSALFRYQIISLLYDVSSPLFKIRY